ncbi:MAG: DNA-processing protein DprA [Candidatus Cryptobacteroides sp.]
MRIDSTEELAPWCALNRIFGFAPRTGLALVKHYGSPQAVFSARKDELGRILGKDSGYLSAMSGDLLERERTVLENLSREGVRVLCIEDERYPSLLRECGDPPAVLYVKSLSPAEDVFTSRPAIGVVGTRNITSYGKEWCTRIVTGMGSAERKPVIISGLAIGTDITAHMAALDSGLPTIAVMATGIDAVYPFRHGWHADRISSSPGSALVTDYPPGTVPRAINFLRRNRIIAGLSEAVILIESRKKGGGMMTCSLAASYNRDVLALPGRVDDLYSEGCNELIARKTAEPITGVQRLLDSLGLGPSSSGKGRSLKSRVYNIYKDREGEELAAGLAGMADLISRNRDITVENICSLTGIDFREAAAMTGILESDGIIATDLLRRCSINPNFV